MRRTVRIVLAALMLAALSAAFCGVTALALPAKVQALPAVLSGNVFGILALAALLAVGGRFYCRVICPLGIAQDLVRGACRRKVRRVCSRLPQSRANLAVKWSVFALFVIGGFAGIGFAALDPYAIFGRAVAVFGMENAAAWFWFAALVPFALVLALAVVGKGRVWCNWVCPVGTVVQAVSKVAVFRDRVDAASGCKDCRLCFAATAERKPADGAAGVSRRGFIAAGSAAVAGTASAKSTDGGLAPVSWPGVPERTVPVLPPGSGSAAEFARKCVGCQLCVAACPHHVLRPSAEFGRFLQPEMGFDRGYCHVSCTKCGEVCPAGAIRPLTAHEKPHVHAGHAEWHTDRCLVLAQGISCNACERHCPVKAIKLVAVKPDDPKSAKVPVVDENACIGCGACENLCPVRPLPGMTVTGHAVQRTVHPAAEEGVK